jgi:CRP/FNR family transcriptional regulator, cyclic AMP receptor protein
MGTPDPHHLQALPLFAELTLADCQRIAAWCEETEYPPGRTIATEGRRDYAFFVVLDGTATVSHGDRVIRTLGPGDHFGEKAILEMGIRTATVTAETQLTALVMMGFHFRELEDQYPAVAGTIEADADRWAAADRELG